MASLRQSQLAKAFGYIPEPDVASIFSPVQKAQQKLTVIDESIFRRITGQDAGPRKMVLLKDGAAWKTAEHYIPSSVTVCEAKAFTRFVAADGDCVALLVVDLKKRGHDRALGANLLLPVWLSHVRQGRLWLDHDLPARVDDLDVLQRHMLPWQGFRVTVAHSEEDGFHVVDGLRLVWCEDQREALDSWGGEAPEDGLRAALTGRKQLPLASSRAQPATLEAPDAKSLRVQRSLYGKSRARVSVHVLEHLLKASYDAEEAAKALGLFGGEVVRSNVTARVVSQYRRHMNDDRELFALVDAVREQGETYEYDWGSRATQDGFCVPWSCDELGEEERLLQAQLLEILGMHTADRRLVVKKEKALDERAKEPEQPVKSDDGRAKVPDYAKNFRRRVAEVPAASDRAHRAASRSRSPRGRRHGGEGRWAGEGQRQRETRQRDGYGQPRQRDEQVQRGVGVRRDRAWMGGSGAPALVPSPMPAPVQPLGLVSARAAALPAFLRDLRRCLTEQAAKDSFLSTESVMQLVRSIPSVGATRALQTLVCAGYDVAGLNDLALATPQMTPEQVEEAFYNFEVLYIHDARLGVSETTLSPGPEWLDFVRWACCTASWASLLARPWVELLQQAVAPLQAGFFANRCHVDSGLNRVLRGFDLGLYEAVRRLGERRPSALDVVAFEQFVLTLDKHVRALWQAGHPKTRVGVNAYSMLVGCCWAVQTCDRPGGRIVESRLFGELRRIARVSSKLRDEVRLLCQAYAQKRQAKPDLAELPRELLEDLTTVCAEESDYQQPLLINMERLNVSQAPWPW